MFEQARPKVANCVAKAAMALWAKGSGEISLCCKANPVWSNGAAKERTLVMVEFMKPHC